MTKNQEELEKKIEYLESKIKRMNYALKRYRIVSVSAVGGEDFIEFVQLNQEEFNYFECLDYSTEDALALGEEYEEIVANRKAELWHQCSRSALNRRYCLNKASKSPIQFLREEMEIEMETDWRRYDDETLWNDLGED